MSSNSRKRSSSLSKTHLHDAQHPRKIRKQEGLDPPTASNSDELSPPSSISELLDFSTLNSQAKIHDRFSQLAESILNSHTILLAHEGNETEFDVLEIEFYLHKSGYHEDPYTHATEVPKYSGRWNFHRAPTRSTPTVGRLSTAAGGYRGGTRKGLDLNIGGPIASTYFANKAGDTTSLLRGGILLRTIRRKSDSVVISGPSLLVDEILRLSGAHSISELVQSKWGGNTMAFHNATSQRNTSCTLFLRPKTGGVSKTTATVYSSSRIGLDLSHSSVTNSLTDTRVAYVAKRYRYFVQAHLLTSNGRGQTFLGVFLTCREAEGCDEDALEQTIKLTGLKEQTASKYFADYSAGVQKGSLQSFIGPSGKGASASPSTYLKMMGALVKAGQVQIPDT